MATTATGVRREERWGAGEDAASREEYRGRDRRDVDDNRSRRDDYRGRERSERSRRDDYRGRDRRNDGDEKLTRSEEERSRRDGGKRYGGDEDRRDERWGRERDGPERRREQESPEKKKDDAEVLEKPSVLVKPAAVPSGRSGGVYIPPFKLAQMMKDVDDKSSVQYQRMTWDALRKSINGLVNKVRNYCWGDGFL